MKRKRLNFKQRDYITGELKNVGYVEMRNAYDPEEIPDREEPEEESGEPKTTPPETEGEPVDLYFYGDIGGAAWETECFEEDKCPQDVQDFFNAIPPEAPVNIYMNSGGGDAYAGLAISNMIRRHKGKTTGHVDGLAASIASVIVSGCDRVIIHTGGQFMMHKPLTIAIGNANDFKTAIKRLDACQERITDVYMSKAREGVTRDTITKLINAETWMGGTAAQRYFNFETDNTQAAVAAQSGYLSSYKHTPKNLLPGKDSTQDIVNAVLSALDARDAEKTRREQQEIEEILNSLDNYGM